MEMSLDLHLWTILRPKSDRSFVNGNENELQTEEVSAVKAIPVVNAKETDVSGLTQEQRSINEKCKHIYFTENNLSH